jgi:hypothetical protein
MRAQPRWAMPLREVLARWLAAWCWPDPGTADLALRRLHHARMQVTRQCDAPMHLVRRSSRVPDALLATASRPSSTDAMPVMQPPAAQASDAVLAPAHAKDMQPASDLPEAPGLPDASTRWRSEWIGAGFFLRALMAPGLWPELLEQAGLSSSHPNDVRALMQALLQAMHVPLTDPIARVWLKDDSQDDIGLSIDPHVRAVANRQVDRWTAWLDEALPDAPEPRLQWVCRRPGLVCIEPGWIALHLDVDQIDTRLRRIGLDLDPGWVPMLQAVVRIRYD